MHSKKPIWGVRAQSVRITKSMSLTVQDARETVTVGGKEKRALQPAARKLVKKLLVRKRRHLPDALFSESVE